MLRNWKWQTLLLLTPGLLLAELAEFAFVAVVGRWEGIQAKLSAYGSLFQSLRTVIRLRREQPLVRRLPDWMILENRTWTLQPREVAIGTSGQLLARIASFPLYVNGWLAWRICRSLRW